MKHKLTKIKQKTEMGCLATCYKMIRTYFEGPDSVKESEKKLTTKAFSNDTGFNEHFYLKKLADSNYKLEVILETPYMLKEYEKLNSELDTSIPIKFNLISTKDIENLLNDGYLIITLLDLWDIDMTIHFPHYVIINGIDKTNIFILDPKYKKEIKCSKNRFESMIENLKYKLEYSPILFAIKKSS